MTNDHRYEQALAGRLADLASAPYPEYVEDVLRTTAVTRRRPAWMFPERWSPVRVPSPWVAVRAVPLRPLAIVILLVMAIAAAVLLAGSRRSLPEPFGLAANGFIAYDNGGDIYTVDPRTGAAVAIVADPAGDTFPLYSPRGERLAFFRQAGDGKDLYVVDIPGGRPTRIGGPFQDVDTVAWSPDGVLIAVGSGIGTSSSPTTTPVIDLVRTDGTGAQRLEVGFGAASPAWRPPDGRQLLFRGQLDTGGELYIVDRDGTDLRRLAVDSQRLVTDYTDVHQGAWSPDGTRISFNAVVMSPDATGVPGQRIQLLDVSPDGRLTRQRQLAFDVGNSDEGWAVWSPRGDRFVFNLAVRDSGVYRIAVGPSDGSGPATMIGPPTTTFAAQEHGWSPDERFVVARYWEENQAWLLDPAGAGGQQVDYWAASATGPSWQRVAD